MTDWLKSNWPLAAIVILLLGVVIIFVKSSSDLPIGGGIIGYSCYQISGIEAQSRPTSTVLFNTETENECQFEKGNTGLFNVNEITNVDETGQCPGSQGCVYVGKLDWDYEVGQIEENCDEKINRSNIKVVGKDGRVFSCWTQGGA